MKRIINDTLISVAAVAVVLLIVVSVDQRVREQVELTASSAGMQQATSRLSQAGTVLFTVARDQSVENAPMAIFVVAGVLLFLFMTRV